MDKKEKKDLQKAIDYQHKVIGIPNKKQADEYVKKGGMVKVSGYTRGDGVSVASYYRARPYC